MLKDNSYYFNCLLLSVICSYLKVFNNYLSNKIIFCILALLYNYCALLNINLTFNLTKSLNLK